MATVDDFADTKWTRDDVAFNRDAVAERIRAVQEAHARLVSTLDHCRVVAESQKDSSLALLLDEARSDLADWADTDLPDSVAALVNLGVTA